MTYKVRLERQVTHTQYAHVYVEAASEEDAEAIADAQGVTLSGWNDNHDHPAYDGHYVVSAELK